MHLQSTPQPAVDPKATPADNADGPAPRLSIGSVAPAATAEVSAPAKDGEADGDTEWVGGAADDEADDEGTLEEEEVGSHSNSYSNFLC